jgi:hypothetical protein
MLRSLIAAVILVASGCSHVSRDGCLPTAAVEFRAKAIANLDWLNATENDVAAAWPGTFDGGSHNSGFKCEPCTGSAEYVEQGRIIGGRHLCAAVLLFGEQRAETGCRSYLSLFVLHHTLPTKPQAWQFGEDVLRIFVGDNNLVLRSTRHDSLTANFAWDNTPTEGVRTSASLNITREPSGYRVWIRLHRSDQD